MKKRILWSGTVLLLVVMSVLIGGGWYFADQIRDGTIKVEHGTPARDLEVANISVDRITLKPMPDIKTKDWQTEGTWGVEGNDGYGQVGQIIDLKDGIVVRKYISLTGKLSTGDKVRLDSYAFPGDPLQARGIAFEEVNYSSNIGSFPAWYIKGSGNIWAIFVHGRGASRREAERILPTVTRLGLPTLVITYRNDDGVPQSPDGLQWFGLTEWQDLEGAVEFATDRGAEGVVLIGNSMGGGIVTNFLYQSPLAKKVKGVILDSPMLDFGAVIDYGASQRSVPVVGTVPAPVIWIAKDLSTIRFGIDYDKLDYLSRMNQIAAPVLLFQGDGDTTIPIKLADTLAARRPDIVRYVRSPGIGHVLNWNILGSKYESDANDFLVDVTQQLR